jgi:hypothetical protein
MCSKLLEGVKDKLDSLKVKAFGYPDFIIWSELEQCPKKSTLLLKELIEVHQNNPNELRKLYQRFIKPQNITPDQFENLQFVVDLTVLHTNIYNSLNSHIEKFQRELIDKVHSFIIRRLNQSQ